MEFKIGDYVRWTSSIHNVEIKKKGKIAYIIDSFEQLSDIIESKDFKDSLGHNVNIIHNNMEEFRPCKSYLVISGGRDGQIPILYWPDNKVLSKIRKRISKKNVIKE